MITPYNTGKVLIGSNYQRPATTWTPSRDQITLQTALLHRGTKRPGVLARALAAFWRWA